MPALFCDIPETPDHNMYIVYKDFKSTFGRFNLTIDNKKTAKLQSIIIIGVTIR